jgi:hypothetical protein
MYNLDDDDIKRMYDLRGVIKHQFPWFDDFIEEQQTYTEFLIQKYWAERVDLIDKDVNILNSGIGYFSVPFCFQRGSKSVHMYDMDPTVVKISNWVNAPIYREGRDKTAFTHHTRNVTFEYDNLRHADVFINTSCEHSYPMATALDERAEGKMCVMSGNNLTKRGHINLINSMDQLKEQCQLSTILNEDVIEFEYEDDLGKRTYQQFFLIGIK